MLSMIQSIQVNKGVARVKLRWLALVALQSPADEKGGWGCRSKANPVGIATRPGLLLSHCVLQLTHRQSLEERRQSVQEAGPRELLPKGASRKQALAPDVIPPAHKLRNIRRVALPSDEARQHCAESAGPGLHRLAAGQVWSRL